MRCKVYRFCMPRNYLFCTIWVFQLFLSTVTTCITITSLKILVNICSRRIFWLFTLPLNQHWITTTKSMVFFNCQYMSGSGEMFDSGLNRKQDRRHRKKNKENIRMHFERTCGLHLNTSPILSAIHFNTRMKCNKSQFKRDIRRLLVLVVHKIHWIHIHTISIERI